MISHAETCHLNGWTHGLPTDTLTFRQRASLAIMAGWAANSTARFDSSEEMAKQAIKDADALRAAEEKKP